MASIVLVLNCFRIKKVDWIWVGIAIFSIVFFVHFNEFRDSNFYRDTALALIIFTVLNFKYTVFDESARRVLLILLCAVLAITVFRVFTEIPVTEGKSIWDIDNGLKEIWINTNTIGASLMTLVLLIVSLLHSMKSKWSTVLVYPIYIVGLLSIWVVQSQSSLYALILFTVVDIWPKKWVVNQRKILGIVYSVFLVFIFPVSLWLANSEKYDLFTGREEIWQAFYRKLFQSGESFLIGPKPFVFNRYGEILGHHNSYNATLGQYGLIGLVILILFILINVWRMVLKDTFSKTQAAFLVAFFSVLLQSTMEDGLMAAFWIPTTFVLLGFAAQFEGKKSNRKETTRLSTDSRATRRSRKKK